MSAEPPPSVPPSDASPPPAPRTDATGDVGAATTPADEGRPAPAIPPDASPPPAGTDQRPAPPAAPAPPAPAPATPTAPAPPAPAKVSRAWPPLVSALTQALAALDDEQFLVLTAKHTNRFVQFASRGAAGLHAEAVANRFLPIEAHLDDAHVALLDTYGWHAPTHTPDQAGSPEADPDGSVNHFLDWPSPPPFDDVAELAVRTLRDVYGVNHPAWLEYRAFDSEGERILLPTLGINRAHDEPDHEEAHPWVGLPPGMELHIAVMQTMKVLLGVDELVVDEDGDIPVRRGTAAIYVRTIEDPAAVVVYSPLLFDVTPSPALYEELNERNTRTYFCRFLLVGTTVMLSGEVFADPFVADDVVNAYLVVSTLADEADDELQASFGGKRAFDETGKKDETSKKAAPPSPPSPPPGTGGYL